MELPLCSLPTVEDDPEDVTTELRTELDSVTDAKALVGKLSAEAGPSRLVLLHHGLTCSGHKTSGPEGTEKDRGDDSTEDQVESYVKTGLCLPIALNAAHVAFDLHSKKVEEGIAPNGEYVDEGDFLQALLNPEFVKLYSRIQDEWKLPSPSLEALIELEPFNDMFGDLVLLSHHGLSSAGILESFQRLWAENASWLPIVAGILTCELEAVLCLRVQVKPSVFAYLVFDSHSRPESDRGPAFVVHKTREGAAEYLYDLWKNLPRSSGSEETQAVEGRFSLHILLPARRPRSFVPPQEEVELEPEPVATVLPELKSEEPKPAQEPTQPFEEPQESRAAEGSEEVRPPNPSPPNPKVTPPIRSKASHNRLQSEFGWQLGLQNVHIVTPLKEKAQEDQPETKDVADPKPVPSGSQSPSTMKTHNRDASSSKVSLSSTRSRDVVKKKDIGWQLTLQEEVGGVTLPLSPKSASTFSEASAEESRHKPQSSNGGSTSVASLNKKAQNSSNTNLSQKSGFSGGHKTPNSNVSSSRAEVERQKLVRGDFGWQMGLAAKSFTLPLSPKREARFNQSEIDNSSDFQKPSHTVGYAALSASPLVATEFGALEETKPEETKSEETKSEEIKPEEPKPEEPEPDLEEGLNTTPDVVDCEYCFGPSVVDELITVASECGHKVCRHCIRWYILHDLEERQFPIPCPVCKLLNNPTPSYITLDLMKSILAFSEADMERFQQLEFQTLPVTLKCPSCKQVANVQRHEVMTSKTIKCSSAACYRSWCRACHGEVRDGQPHECKTKIQKREKMLGKKGSRYCPGCQTLAKRHIANDNHMVCPSTLCGMHFCFKCGDVIADTVKGQDADRFSFLHYRGCTQFEEDEKCCIQ